MASGPHPDPALLLSEARGTWAQIGRLSVPPAGLEATRTALHRVAEEVLSAARKRATGSEIALRWYPGGFGTPPFPDDGGSRVVRVDGLELVDSREGADRRVELTSLRATGTLVGDLVDEHLMPDDDLDLRRSAARFLDEWFCFATLVIAMLRVGADDALDPGWVQLWPEHFDVATELGSEERGRRAAYGASPGDAEHPEPYVYVAPWAAQPEGDLWNATAFTGAELSYRELLAAGDPEDAAAEFFESRLGALTG
jgi:hypothetical protein